MKEKIGFIGLGAMGYPMAKHLFKQGKLDVIWNRSDSVSAEFSSEHTTTVACNLLDLADRSTIIVLCVSADQDVMDIINHIAPHLHEQTLIIDHSSIAPDTANNAAARLREQHIGFLDAPVSGGIEGARQGTLSVMVGGQADDLERARPFINCYAARITHMGVNGNGQATKAVNQVLVAGIAEAVCEGLALAEQLQLPATELLNVLRAGAGGSWFLDKRGATMLDDNCTDGFKLELLLKDLNILNRLAKTHNLELPGVQRAITDYQQCLAAGDGDQDISALIRLKRNQITQND